MGFAVIASAESRRTVARLALVVVGVAALAWTTAVWATAGVSAAPRPPCAVSAGVTFSVHNTVITGTAGDDTIDCRNSRKGFTIYGMGTDGSASGDQIWGGRGRDVIWGDRPGAPACAAPWADIALYGGGGNDEIHGGMCVAFAEGGPGNDLIIAEGGCNHFRGDDGDDTIDGTKSSDVSALVGGCVGTAAHGGPGNDHIFTLGALNLDAFGDEGNDVLDGANARDGLDGGQGDDSLNGNGGNDALVGGPGIDQLGGGDGDDFLIDDSSDADFFIGGGNDTFPDGTLLFPDGYAGDRCFDQDGEGTAPDYPEGSGTVGSVSAVQNDSISGCEVLYVSPVE